MKQGAVLIYNACYTKQNFQHDWRIYTEDVSLPSIPRITSFGVTSARKTEEKLFHQPQVLRDAFFDVEVLGEVKIRLVMWDGCAEGDHSRVKGRMILQIFVNLPTHQLLISWMAI
jgi:hypothetical protein